MKFLDNEYKKKNHIKSIAHADGIPSIEIIFENGKGILFSYRDTTSATHINIELDKSIKEYLLKERGKKIDKIFSNIK